MLILTLDYNTAKAEPDMFKHNKHMIEEQNAKKKKTTLIIYFINDKEENTEGSVMMWSERADKNDKRKQPKCVRRVGTAICTVRTKNGQIH